MPTKPAKPTVVIDARMVDAIGHGIGIYVENLAKGLAENKTELPYELLFLLHETPRSSSALHEFRTKHVDIPFLHPAESLLLPIILRREKAALYHSPSFSSLLYYPCPHILTIHDLNHLHFGSLKQRAYYSFLLKRAARSAAQVFTVSEFSRGQIQSWIPGLKVEIAENAITPLPSPTEQEAKEILQKFGLKTGEYFFCHANSKPHKNTEMLKRAHEIYSRETKTPLPLVLATTTGPLSEKELATLLHHCTAFYFPSLYEGFGRPPLEAALEGAPIVASNIPAHEEALRFFRAEEKLLLPPEDDHAWAKAFHAAQEKKLTRPSTETRQKITANYSVEKLAATMDRAYRNT